MATNKFLSLEQFTFIANPPNAQISSLRANTYEDGRMILNGKLAAELSGKSVQIRFTDDAKHICFVEGDFENTVKFPKKGQNDFPPPWSISKSIELHCRPDTKSATAKNTDFGRGITAKTLL